MAHGDKTRIAIEIMEANVAKSYDEVSQMIADAIGVDIGRARVYYRHKVINGIAKGYDPNVRPWEGKAKVKSEPKPKAVKATVKPVAKPVKPAKAKAEPKPDVDIAKIKAANLAKLRAVSAKTKQYTNVARGDGPGVAGFDADDARAEVTGLIDSLESFAAPKFLSKAAIKSLV
jgi:hypothetical protein